MSKDPFWWTKYVTLNPEFLSDYFSREEATELIDKFKREFPEVKNWMDSENRIACMGRAVRVPTGEIPSEKREELKNG